MADLLNKERASIYHPLESLTQDGVKRLLGAESKTCHGDFKDSDSFHSFYWIGLDKRLDENRCIGKIPSNTDES